VAFPANALPAGAPPERVTILVRAGVPDERPVAERIQVKLFDRGVRAAVETADPVRFASRLATGDCDVALVTVDLAARPALAAGQIALAVAGPDAARRAMAEMAGLEGEAAAATAERLARSLDVVPLFVAGLRASAAPALQGLAPRSDGGFEPGDLWLLPRTTR
jgi:peptide/nickel transport system substrate-binding protein